MGLLHAVTTFFSSHDVLHPQLSSIYARMTLIDKLLFHIIHFVDRYYAWYKLPVFLGLAYLDIRRTLHQRYNLINVGRSHINIRMNPADIPYRTADGKYNDPFNIEAGDEGSFFGRNMLPSHPPHEFLDPHPSVVATKLLARRKLADTGKQFNMLAACWIQFMIHDWVDHLEDTEQLEITAPASVAGSCPLKSFRFYRSKEFPTGSYDIKIGYRNRRTPWWDGSSLYGNDQRTLNKVRTFKDGKLRLATNGLLEHDSEGKPISGDIRNGWAGLSVMQALFVKEHNSICDMLKKHYPEFEDDELYRRARLVTSAVIAKIHTIDWTVELLKMDTLHAAMRANWYGLLGKTFKDRFGHTGVELLSGFVGMPKPVNHGVPYSLTEEFVSVYRMHSLLPDAISVRDITSPQTAANHTPALLKEVPMPDLVGPRGELEVDKIGNETMLASMGHQACGALTLWNYPLWLRDIIPENIDGSARENHVDLPSLEIFRDRERSVPRYNEFRRNMLMIPIQSWADLTSDEETIATLKEVYGDDVEKLDLQVGLMAEKKIKGYAISETAFYIFVLMASRRLEADRFFTADYKETVYTKEGLAWVNTTESLKDVLIRHHGRLVEMWLNSGISAFTVWSADPAPYNPIPLYLRTPTT